MKKQIWAITSNDLATLLEAEVSKVELLNRMFNGDTSKWFCEYYFGFDEYNMTNKYTLAIFIEDGSNI